MGPDTTQSWNRLPHDPRSPVTAMSGHLELLQRQLLRARGLTSLERDLLLGTLAAARSDLEDLARRLDGQTRDRNHPEGGNDAGWSRR